MATQQQHGNQQGFEQFGFPNVTPQQVQGQIASLPIQMVYQAREALQQVKDSNLSGEEVVQLVEPLGRAIGWAEALVFALDKTTERDMIRSLISNGTTKVQTN